MAFIAQSITQSNLYNTSWKRIWERLAVLGHVLPDKHFPESAQATLPRRQVIILYRGDTLQWEIPSFEPSLWFYSRNQIVPGRQIAEVV